MSAAMLNRIAAEVLNKPLLCRRDYAETMLAFLGDRVGIDASDLNSGNFTAREPSYGGGNKTLSIIPIIGSMTHRAGWLEGDCGMRSYEGIERDLDASWNNSDVGAILLDMDTPGGTVAGAFDLADKIRRYANAGGKKIYALAHDQMTSAGYLLASQCNNVFATQTAMVGSIGVVMAHLDRSKNLEMQGLKPTFIFKGDLKTDGNGLEPLSEESKARIQAGIDEAYDMFVSAVVHGRNKLSAEDVIATQAGIFSAKEAQQLGLIDGVMSYEAAVEWAASQAAHHFG